MSDVLNGGLSGIQGNNNQWVNIGGNNTGHVISGPANFYGPGNEVAQYRLTARGRYANLWELAMPGLIKLGIAVLLGLVQWFGGSTLFNALGVSPLLAIVMVGLTIFLGVRGVYQLAAPLSLLENVWTRRMSHYYERQADGSIVEAQVSAKCPVYGCAGTISLQRPVRNQEGVECAGICSDHGHLHAFEFNEQSYEGTRLFLHPVQEDQRPR